MTIDAMAIDEMAFDEKTLHYFTTPREISETPLSDLMFGRNLNLSKMVKETKSKANRKPELLVTDSKTAVKHWHAEARYKIIIVKIKVKV